MLKKLIFAFVITLFSVNYLCGMDLSSLAEFPTVDIFEDSPYSYLSARAARWVHYIRDQAEEQIEQLPTADILVFSQVVLAHDAIQSAQQGAGVNHNPLSLMLQLNLVRHLDAVQALLSILQEPCYAVMREEIMGDLLAAAVFENSKQVIELLVYYGVNLNHKSQQTKQTALMYAVQSLYKHLVAYFLKLGAKVNKISVFGQTALDMGEENNMQIHCEDIIILLKRYGALTSKELNELPGAKN